MGNYLSLSPPAKTVEVFIGVPLCKGHPVKVSLLPTYGQIVL